MSDCLRFFTDNYIDSDIISGISASSEANGFAKENALDLTRRTKMWRTAGGWDIDSSNNGIVFEETASTPLTASIATGLYTSTTSLLTAIDTALEAVGASDYTSTVDSTTGKITIASDGAGGSGIFNLLWSNAGSTAGSILGFDTASDMTGALSYSADELKISNGEWLVFDLGMASRPTSFIFTSNRNKPINISYLRHRVGFLVFILL